MNGCSSNQPTLQHVLPLYRWPACPLPYHAHFDINVALLQYHLVLLSVDFQCTDLKKLPNSVFTYLIMSCKTSAQENSYIYYPCYSFTPDHIETLPRGCLGGRTAFIYVLFEKYGYVWLGIFVFKMCKLSFFVQYIY